MSLLKYISVFLLLVPSVAWAEMKLLMAEEKGCIWCARWNDEISDIYPKTDEGQKAPLQRFDIHSDRPEIEFQKAVIFTPTFILTEDGKELGRIEGYPGEDSFWFLLSKLIEAHDK